MKEVFENAEGYSIEGDERVIFEYETGLAELESLEEWKVQRIETIELKTVESLYELEDGIVRAHKQSMRSYSVSKKTRK